MDRRLVLRGGRSGGSRGRGWLRRLVRLLQVTQVLRTGEGVVPSTRDGPGGRAVLAPLFLGSSDRSLVLTAVLMLQLTRVLLLTYCCCKVGGG